MLRRYIPVLDNWAVCDAYCANAKWMAHADKEILWSFLQQWFCSHREFEVRFAIVTAMCYFLDEEWLAKVFKRIEALNFNAIVSEYRTIKGKPQTAQQGTVQGCAPYYVRMGVAWLLATALANFPEQTRAFAHTTTLPDDVIRLYTRKARESFRTRHVNAL
jgi:3-methyladenine DNA glycosylase AlkD